MLSVMYSTQVLTRMSNTIYKTSFEVSIPFAVNLLQIWSRLCTILYEWLIFFKHYCISLRQPTQISIFESSIWVETSHWLERSSSSSATLFPLLPLPLCTHVPPLFSHLHIPVFQLWENKIYNDGKPYEKGDPDLHRPLTHAWSICALQHGPHNKLFP